MNYNYYNNDSDLAEILTFTRCNFTKLGSTSHSKVSIGTTILVITCKKLSIVTLMKMELTLV